MTYNNLKVPILMYHEIVDDNCNNKELLSSMPGSYFVKKSIFQRQMELLSKEGFNTISLNELIDYFNGVSQSSLPKRCVIITFDDGYEGNYKYAYPVLERYGFTATFFVTVKWIGGPFMMNWQQLVEMVKSEMSVQSHTLNHPFLKQLKYRDMVYQLKESKRILEEKLHVKVNFLSLPHGSYGDNYKKIAIEMGYKGGCSSRASLNDKTVDPYFLYRFNVPNKFNLISFRKIIKGEGNSLNYLILQKKIKEYVRKILGENLYKKIYDFVFNLNVIDES